MTWCGCSSRPTAAIGGRGRGQHDHGHDDDAGQVLGPAVAVGVAAGGTPPAEQEREAERHRGQRVGRVVQRVAEQCDRAGQRDHHRLRQRGRGQPGQRDPQGPQALGRGFEHRVDRAVVIVGVRPDRMPEPGPEPPVTVLVRRGRARGHAGARGRSSSQHDPEIPLQHIDISHPGAAANTSQLRARRTKADNRVMDNGDRLTTTATAERMAGAASAFLGALTEEQRKQACYGFGDERRSWSYLPARDRDGLPIGALDAGQRKLGHELIVTGTSMPAYAKVVSVIAMEHRAPGDGPGVAGGPVRPGPVLLQGVRLAGRGGVGLAVRRASRGAQLHRRRRPVRLPHPVHAGLPARVVRHARAAGRRRGARLPAGELARRRPAARRHHPPPAAAGPGGPDGAEDRRDRTAGPGVRPRAGLRDQRGGTRHPVLRPGQPQGHPGRRPEPAAVRFTRGPGRGVRAATARRGGRGAAARPGTHGHGQPHLRLGGRYLARRPALLPGAGADAAHRARQHAGKRYPHPFGVAEPDGRFRRRRAGGALPGAPRPALRAHA